LNIISFLEGPGNIDSRLLRSLNYPLQYTPLRVPLKRHRKSVPLSECPTLSGGFCWKRAPHGE